MTWPKPQPPFDHGQCLGFVHDGDVLTGGDIARFHPLYIFGDAQHAVGVVSGQVGLNQVFGHDAGLVPFQAGGDENVLGDGGQLVRRKCGHGYLLFVS